MSWLRAIWRWLLSLFTKGGIVTVTASATLTSTGSLAAPKLGDVHTYTVTVLGEVAKTASVGVGKFTNDGTDVPISGGPWTWPILASDQFTAPVVTGFSYSKPFAQTADPHVWVATY